MSLDFYINVPVEGYYTRENGKMIFCPKEDSKYEMMHVANITHNLNEMAMNVPVKDGLTLYNVLWRPEESNLTTTDDIFEYVETGIKYMVSHKEELLKFNPKNGWGDYDGLLDFARRVGSACVFNPGCKIDADR